MNREVRFVFFVNFVRKLRLVNLDVEVIGDTFFQSVVVFFRAERDKLHESVAYRRGFHGTRADFNSATGRYHFTQILGFATAAHDVELVVSRARSACDFVDRLLVAHA